MESRTLSSVDLIQCALQRVQQTQNYLNSVLEINPDALTIAAALDIERDQGPVRSNLHGIPFLVKDNIASKDKMQTTAGSFALLGSIVPRDAHVVAKLREAGAVLLGKAGLSEWADMRSNDYSEGYSARGGQTRGPYNLTINAGGSSTGSGVAVAANIVPFALGTETDGSMITPADRNAIVAIKPTVGLTSRAGTIPESEHQDSVGVFARTLRDAVYVLDAIYGPDERDNYTLAQIDKTSTTGFSSCLAKSTALNGITIGIPWATFWRYTPEVELPTFLTIIDLLKSAGATIVNGTEVADAARVVSPDGWNWDYGTTRGFANESEYSVVKVDFYNNIKTYLSELNNINVRSLEDIVAYNFANDGSEGGNPGNNPAFKSGQDGFLASLASKGIQNETYWQALAFCQRTSREDGIDAMLNQGPGGTRLDALLVPPRVGQTYEMAAQAGYPYITIPAGVMGSAWEEDKLIQAASAMEDVIKQGQAKGLKMGRTLPQWRELNTRNVPVINI
ncbi:amidase family protein [Myriangium duriaei CBS 260.36]|uniref:Amidase family protein n=1 Tax=Myriangium duriaei CBS 260.36 TaxID=1168546 RepID=A0A9P4IT85_9PEZI|nr:amidase family protein [Myriangium duriaei CBS 260.36]